jgi:hypothetical protein
MAERVAGHPERVLVISSDWRSPYSEAAFVVRSVAGALSRHALVEVVATAAATGNGSMAADGLFDIAQEPRTDVAPDFVVVVAGDEVARTMAERRFPSAPVVTLGDGSAGADPAPAATWSPGVPAVADAVDVGLHVAVNPLAAERPHNGFGFTGYLLVLTDRGGGDGQPDDDPTGLARWLAAAFPRHHLVVIESGAASVWRCRALRGAVTVDSRTDLWRLLAHARAVIDLRPGTMVARECVEAQRFGSPVIVPAGTAAGRLAQTGGGLTYEAVDGLFDCVDMVDDDDRHAALSAAGRAAADARYGDADAFVTRVGAAMAAMASVAR